MRTIAADAGGRCVQEGIPPSRTERQRLLDDVRRYVRTRRLVPPLSLAELEACTSEAPELAEVSPGHQVACRLREQHSREAPSIPGNG